MPSRLWLNRLVDGRVPKEGLYRFSLSIDNNETSIVRRRRAPSHTSLLRLRDGTHRIVPPNKTSGRHIPLWKVDNMNRSVLVWLGTRGRCEAKQTEAKAAASLELTLAVRSRGVSDKTDYLFWMQPTNLTNQRALAH